MIRTVEFKPIKGYEMINDNLGAGSFGKTVLIRDPSIDELFVCKKYAPQPGLKKEEFFLSFKKEIKLMYKLNHPNVVRVFTYYLYEETYTGYIIMEYIDGESIDKWFSAYWTKEADSNNIFRQLIEGFACMEASGIIHRDIRENNILISKNDIVKIIDFGLGKDVNEYKVSIDSFNKLINRQQMQKVPNEFSEGKYTSKTDMFCIAELFNRMLKKYSIEDFKHNYILQKMMNPDPAKRYASFSEIIVALDKKEFKGLEISEQDKEIYNAFIGALMYCISKFTGAPEIETNKAKLIEGLYGVLEANCLNYNINNVSALVRVMVHSGYRYYTRREIEVSIVQNFYDWFINKDEAFQDIVMKNMVNRLLSIEVEEELPF